MDSVPQIAESLETSSSVVVIDLQESLKLLRELQNLTANSDPRALDLIEKLLIAVESNPELTERFVAAKELLDVYNFNDAALSLENVEEEIGELSLSSENLPD